MVPLGFYRKDGRVTSLMIEVNRRLYMDEVTGHRMPELAKVRKEDFIGPLGGYARHLVAVQRLHLRERTADAARVSGRRDDLGRSQPPRPLALFHGADTGGLRARARPRPLRAVLRR